MKPHDFNYLLLLWLMVRWVLLAVRVEFVMRLAVMQTVRVTFSIVPHNKLNSIDDMVYGLNDAIRRPIMFAGHVYENVVKMEEEKKRIY